MLLDALLYLLRMFPTHSATLVHPEGWDIFRPPIYMAYHRPSGRFYLAISYEPEFLL